MRKVLIIGATSAIAQATARKLAGMGDALFLAGRNADKLEVLAVDLRIRGAKAVHTGAFEALESQQHGPLLSEAEKVLGGLDVALIAHGQLPDQAACQASAQATRQAFAVNAESVIGLLTVLAEIFEQQGSGTMAVISSVAGDRGRKSNYVYGAAKGAVSLFMQGLRNRLQGSGVRVITIKPGFVDTPMTEGFDKGALWAQPGQVAGDIVKAIDKGRDVVYTPGYWRYIMWVIRLIPESLFKRLSI